MEYKAVRRAYQSVSPCQITYVGAVKRFRGDVGTIVVWRPPSRKYAPSCWIRAGPWLCAPWKICGSDKAFCCRTVFGRAKERGWIPASLTGDGKAELDVDNGSNLLRAAVGATGIVVTSHCMQRILSRRLSGDIDGDKRPDASTSHERC